MSGTVTELAEHFQAKVTNLKNCISLSNAKGEPGCRALMNNINSDLREMAILLKLFRADINKRKEAIEAVHAMQTQVGQLQQRISHAQQNMPTRLPQHTMPPPPVVSERPEENYLQAPPRSPGKVSRQESVSSLPENNGRRHSVKEGSGMSSKLANLPSIAYLTVEEFNSVPKYIKGRITYDQVNKALDEINKTLYSKYKVMYTPKSSLTDLIRKQIRVYKDMENKDTKGSHFVVDGDIQELSRFKLDASGRCILTMLRHCGRLREIRGGGLTRYAVVV